MKIAVTGGNGFIGQAVMRVAQNQQHEVWSVDRAHGLDVTDLDSLDGGLEGADAVIHLAGVLGTAELFDDIDLAIAVNIQGSTNVMRWCAQTGARYVGILMPDVFPSIYTATKVASKRIADALHHSRGLQVSHVRAFNAYGPGQKYGHGHPQKILPTFAVHAWHRKPIPVWGSGNQTVDMVHTADLAEMLVDAVRFTDNQVFDGGTGHGMTVLDVARVVARATGWDEPAFEMLPMRAGERETHIHAEGEGWDLLGWRPRHDTTMIEAAALSYKGVAL